jgi:hypothetical protein
LAVRFLFLIKPRALYAVKNRNHQRRTVPLFTIGLWSRIKATPFGSGEFLCLIAGLLCLSGCAFSAAGPKASDYPQASPRVEIPGVPFFAQEAYQCGPAALAMVLQWGGSHTTPSELTPQVYIPERKGSLQSNIIGAARRHRRLAYEIYGWDCLVRELSAGHPVLVLQNLGIKWLPRWHYAVVLGYDLENGYVILHSGVDASRQVGFRAFEQTWRRAGNWGLVVLPVDRMPICAEEQSFLKAVFGLQQAGALAESVVAFQNAARYWPQSSQAHIALGNALYASGDLAEAAAAFSRACEVDPTNGPAFNNLAHVLSLLGRWEEAETAARRAVALGGPHLDLFRKTLEEILQQQ